MSLSKSTASTSSAEGAVAGADFLTGGFSSPDSTDAAVALLSAVRAAGVGLWHLDLGSGVLYPSREFRAVVGWPTERQSVRWDQWTKVIHPDDLARVLTAHERVVEGPRSLFDEEFRIQKPSGQWLWVQVVSDVLQRNVAGAALRMSGCLIDISHRKYTEETLRRSEREKSFILSSISEGIALIGRDFETVWINDSLAAMAEISPSDVVGCHCYRAIFGRGEVCNRCAAVRTMETGKTHWFEVEHNDRTFRVTASPVRDEKGRLIGCIDVFQDITDEKRLEDQLRLYQDHLEEVLAQKSDRIIRSERRYRALFENAMNAVVLHQEGRIIDTNPAACELFGYDREALVGMPIVMLCGETPDEAAARFAQLSSALETRGSYETEQKLRRRDGKLLTVELRASWASRDEGIVETCMFDITARKEAERKLLAAKMRLHLGLTAAKETVWQWYGDTRRLVVEPYLNDVFGFPKEYYPRLRDLLRRVHPEDRPRLEGRVAQLRRGEGVSQIGTCYRFRDARGEYRWLSLQGELIRPEGADRPSHIIGVARDVTEERQQQELLIQSEKLISLGTLVAGVAHEINNPNNALSMNLPMLRELCEHMLPVLDEVHRERGDFPLGNRSYAEMRDRIPRLLETSEQATRRIKTIVEELKHYSRPAVAHEAPERVDLNRVFQSAFALIRKSIQSKCRNVRAELAERLPPVDGHFQRLEQVIINLLNNAVESLDDPNGEVLVRTWSDQVEQEVHLSVRDQGCGISPDDLSRVTTPFFTTKRHQGGTGLGLSVCQSILAEHHGRLRFASTVGEGTTATVTMPWAATLGTEND